MMSPTGRAISVAALLCVVAVAALCLSYTVLGIVFLPIVFLLFPIFAIAMRPRR